MKKSEFSFLLGFSEGIEVGRLQMLHCAIIPWLDYDIPIFSLDLLESGDSVTLATCDLFPVLPDGNIPQLYTEAIR